MKSLLLLLLLPLAATLQQLTYWTLRDALRQRPPLLLVCFYADFHLDDLQHFKYYSQLAQRDSEALQVAAVQIDQLNLPKLNGSFGVDTFQVMLFSGTYRLPFDMFRGFYHLPAFLRNRHQVVQPLSDLSHFMAVRQALPPSDGLIAVLFLNKSDQELLEHYVEVTNSFRDSFGCYVVTDKTLSETLQAKQQLVVYRNFDQPKVVLSRPEKNNMGEFLQQQQHPSLLRVTVENHRFALYEVRLPVLLLVIERDQDPVSQKYVAMLGRVRDSLRGKHQFCYFPLGETTLRTFFNNYLNYPLSIGSVFLYNPNPEADFPDRYLFHGPVLSEEALLSFSRQYLQNELAQYRRTQVVQEEEQGLVRVLTTETYPSIQENNRPTLLMLYYSADLTEDLEKHFGYLCRHWTHSSVDFARLDLSQNEVTQDLLGEEEKGKVVLVSFFPGGEVKSEVVRDPFRFDDILLEQMVRLMGQPHKQDL